MNNPKPRVRRMVELLEARYGIPERPERDHPLDSMVLTILSQSTNDKNRDMAYRGLRQRFRSWKAVAEADPRDIADAIRPGGLANQKAPRIQATLTRIREERGDYSLEFLGEMSALDARDWLTRIDGIGRKTASVLLLFSFGLPLMPVDRHVERVAQQPTRTPNTPRIPHFMYNLTCCPRCRTLGEP